MVWRINNSPEIAMVYVSFEKDQLSRKEKIPNLDNAMCEFNIGISTKSIGKVVGPGKFGF